jgi:hypothetical protein
MAGVGSAPHFGIGKMFSTLLVNIHKSHSFMTQHTTTTTQTLGVCVMFHNKFCMGK